jgi:membrane associated rhomboid family serine protease
VFDLFSSVLKLARVFFPSVLFVAFAQMFSHAGGLHMLFNCWALWSFAPPIINSVLGTEQFLALYLSAGVVSRYGV